MNSVCNRNKNMQSRSMLSSIEMATRQHTQTTHPTKVRKILYLFNHFINLFIVLGGMDTLNRAGSASGKHMLGIKSDQVP